MSLPLSLTSNISICALTTVFARSDRWQNFWQNVQNKANSGELSWLFDLNERINQPTATFVTWNAIFWSKKSAFHLETNCHFPGVRYHYYLFLKGIMIKYSEFRFCSFHLMTSMLEFPTRESLRCFKDSMSGYLWQFSHSCWQQPVISDYVHLEEGGQGCWRRGGGRLWN